MEPLIPINAELIVKKLNEHDILKKFDILLFKQDENLICHFLWHQNIVFDEGSIITKSLKNSKEDLPFKRKQIIGVVTNYKINLRLKLKVYLREYFYDT